MKTIALISGGLDSILAARIIKEQGIEIIPLNFKIPFCSVEKSSAPNNRKVNLVRENLGVDLKVVDISNDFLKILQKPRYGFGSNMNPCIDCKILMLEKVKELMPQWGIEFVVTGEVLGQRPMSQHKQALEIIAKRSGLEGLVLRPLSAKLLPETIPEQKGWVNRQRLLDFSGRTRKPQMNLAKTFQMKDYPNASGGCLLTDRGFTKRLKDLIIHQELNLENVELLKWGRLFRLSEKAKLVVGRNEKENITLMNLAKTGDLIFYPAKDTAGPTAIGRGDFTFELIKVACEITCHYCDLNGKANIDIIYRKVNKEEVVSEKEASLNVSPIEERKLSSLRI